MEFLVSDILYKGDYVLIHEQYPLGKNRIVGMVQRKTPKGSLIVQRSDGRVQKFNRYGGANHEHTSNEKYVSDVDMLRLLPEEDKHLYKNQLIYFKLEKAKDYPRYLKLWKEMMEREQKTEDKTPELEEKKYTLIKKRDRLITQKKELERKLSELSEKEERLEKKLETVYAKQEAMKRRRLRIIKKAPDVEWELMSYEEICRLYDELYHE